MNNPCIVALLLALASACTPIAQVQRLPTYEVAVSLVDAETPAVPKLFISGRHSEQFQGELVPYCTYELPRNSNTEQGYAAVQRLKKLVEHMPDAVIYYEGQQQVVGAVSQYWGWGVATSTPVYAAPTLAVGYREAPCVYPLKCDSSGMVLAIRDKEACGQIQEGDTLLTIGQHLATYKDWVASLREPIWKDRLHLKPGDTQDAVWIRPGVGRMAGPLKMLPNPRKYLEEADSADLSKLPKLRKQMREGRPVWYFEEWDY